MSNIIDEIEKKQVRKDLPYVSVGDTVVVHKQIIEGKKKRIQKFEGVVIAKKGSLSRETITVRKIVDKVGVEKSYFIHSPTVSKIDIKVRGKVRRAKLRYLRDRIGTKARRIKTKASSKVSK